MQTRVLTMQFTDHDGNPLANRKVWVTASTRVYDTAGHVVLEPIPVIITLNANGYATRDFLCSDSDGINPTGWTYRLTPSWKNARPIDFKLVKGSGSVSIDQIGSVPASTGTSPTPSGSYDPAGSAAAAQSAAISTAATALASHESDTTNIHGIANTASLVVTSDSRLTNSRTPTAHAASHETSGSDPITVTQSQVTGLTSDLAGKVSSSDSRLTDSRTPTVHKSTHATGGVDALTPSDIGAIPNSEKGASPGVATLDGSGKIPTTQLPALAITSAHVVASQSAMLGLTAQEGDVAVRTDLAKSFILRAEPASTLANWQELLSPTGTVSSVDGRTGTISLSDLYAPATGISPTAITGTAVTTADLRLSDSRTPTVHASSHTAAGSDPLTLAQSQVTNLTTDLAGKVSASDSRLSDARTPTAHKTSHSTGGADAIAPGDIGATPSSRTISAGTGLTGGGDLTADRTLAVSYGSTAGTAAQGNDARLSDARTPTAHKSSHASGGADAITPSDIGAVAVTRSVTAGTGLTGGGDLTADRTLSVTYGTTAGTSAQGNDARLTDSRTPTPHAASHASAGSDPVTVAQSQVTGLTSDLASKVSTTDSRLSDARTPTAHKSTHAIGGTDVLSPADIGAVASSEKGANSGVATLDGTGKIPSTQLPALAITSTFVVASQTAQLALAAQEGDVAVRTDLSKSFILRVEPASTLANWQELLTPTDAVTSVDGRTGTVSLTDLYAPASGISPTAITGTAVANSDSRLTDARTPTSHKVSHSTGGTDALAPADIGAVPTARTVTAGTGLTGGGDLSADRTLAVSYGTTSGTAAQGNDSRLSDARTPTAHASSHAAAGSDPLTVAQSQVTNLTTDLAGKVSTSDSRLTDARTPTAHKASHATGGTDALAPSDIGAVPTSRTITAGTGLTGGGDLTANRTLTVSYGSTAGTAAQGNDSRLSDARTPTVHAASHSSANLFTNPSLEVDTTGWSPQGSGAGITRIVTDAYVGSACLQVTLGAGIETGTQIAPAYPYLPITGGASYTFSAYVKIPAGQSALGLQAWCRTYNSSISPVGDYSSTTTTVTSAMGWTQITFTFTAPPTASYSVFRVWRPSAGTAGDVFLIDNASVSGSDPITVAQSQITNLTTDLAAKAPLASPTFTGTVILPAGTVTPSVVGSQISAKSSAYTLTSSDSVVTATGTMTVTLPDATSSGISGRLYTIRNISTGVVTIARTSSQTIDGCSGTITLAGKGQMTVISDGANWLVVGAEYSNESSGRRLYTWSSALASGATAGWQMTYSDTGWRAVVQFDSTGTFSTGSFPGTSIAPYPGAAGGLFIRRVDNLVTFRLQSIALTTASMSSFTTNRIWYWVSGFNPLSTHAQIALGWNGSSYVSVSLRASVGDQALEVDYPQTVAVNTLLNCNLYMPTNDAWPSSLPGVAQWSIPT